MKKVYSPAKQPPNCPRCDDTAAWKHDAKGRWWCRTCGRAFTPGITAAGNHTRKIATPQAAAVVPDASMRTRVSRPRATKGTGNVDYYEEGDVEYDYYTNGDSEEDLIPSHEGSLFQAEYPNKIRKLTNRRPSTDRYKSDDGEAYEEEEDGSKKRKIREGDLDVKVKGERPKKAPTLCPHTDKPYYAKGKCRPCYWAEWRREGGKKSNSKDVSPGSAKGKAKLREFEAEEKDSTIKRQVKLEDAQCMAFKLNKSTDYQSIYDLLLELRTYYITDEILRSSLLLIVVKKLTQSPCVAIADISKVLFDEFAEILSGRSTTDTSSLLGTSNGVESTSAQDEELNNLAASLNYTHPTYSPYTGPINNSYPNYIQPQAAATPTHPFPAYNKPSVAAAVPTTNQYAPVSVPAADQMTLVNEIAMMHNAIAQLSHMNNAMLNNLTAYQASKLIESLPPSLQGVVFPLSPSASPSIASAPAVTTTPSTTNFDSTQFPALDTPATYPYYAPPPQPTFHATANTTTTTTTTTTRELSVEDMLSYGLSGSSDRTPVVPRCPTPDGLADGTVPQTNLRFAQTDRIIKAESEFTKQTMGFTDLAGVDSVADNLIFVA